MTESSPSYGGLESRLEEFIHQAKRLLTDQGGRLDRVSLNLEAVADNLRTLAAGLTRLEAIQETHLRSHG